MILKIWAKASVPKTLVQQKRRLHSLYFPQNTLMLTESRGKFSDLHSIFRLRALDFLFKTLHNDSHDPKSMIGSVPMKVHHNISPVKIPLPCDNHAY